MADPFPSWPPLPPSSPPTIQIYALMPTVDGRSSENCTGGWEADDSWETYILESQVHDPYCARVGAEDTCNDICRRVGTQKDDCMAEPELKVWHSHTKVGMCNSCYNESVRQNKSLGYRCRDGAVEVCVRTPASESASRRAR